MSTSMQKDSCYFSHDANAKDDLKCMYLIDQMGLEGYGIFWILIETLREQQNYKYPFNLLASLSRKYNTTSAKMETVINAYDLFQVDNDNLFFSVSLNRRMQFFEQKKAQQIEAGRKGVLAKKRKKEQQLKELSIVHSTNRPLNDPQATKIKETKIKETKLKETTNLVGEVMKFKKKFIKNYMFEGFYLNEMKDETLNHKYYTLNDLTLICEVKSQELVSREQAIEIWQFLYFENLKKGENQIAS